MAKLLRLTAAGSAAAALLAGAATASPALVVRTAQLVGVAGPATIATRESVGTYRTTVLAPAAYRLARSGAQVGTATMTAATASGQVQVHGLVTGARLADYALDQCAAFSTSHLGVWSVTLRQVDGHARVEIPVFLDAAPGGRTELTWCASAAADMTVTAVALHLDHAFLNPRVAGRYAWHAQIDNMTALERSVLGAITTSATAVVRVRARR